MMFCSKTLMTIEAHLVSVSDDLNTLLDNSTPTNRCGKSTMLISCTTRHISCTPPSNALMVMLFCTLVLRLSHPIVTEICAETVNGFLQIGVKGFGIMGAAVSRQHQLDGVPDLRVQSLQRLRLRF